MAFLFVRRFDGPDLLRALRNVERRRIAARTGRQVRSSPSRARRLNPSSYRNVCKPCLDDTTTAPAAMPRRNVQAPESARKTHYKNLQLTHYRDFFPRFATP